MMSTIGDIRTEKVVTQLMGRLYQCPSKNRVFYVKTCYVNSLKRIVDLFALPSQVADIARFGRARR